MPAHDVIDNRQEKLIDHIRRILPGSQAAHFAVGYFFLSGLEAVADCLSGVRELRLLIGNTSNRETIEQIAEGYARLEQLQDAAEALALPRRADIDRAIDATARAIGQTVALMDQTPAAAQLVSTLVRLIREGRLKVRVYTKGRLHAKAYIFDYGPIYDAQGRPLQREEKGLAIVGSSNFTLAGVTNNTELNVLIHGNENHAKLTAWFEDLWKDSQDFEPALMHELGKSWPLAQATPYEIYLKTLYDLAHETVEEVEAQEFLWRGHITGVLTDFQEQAVRQAVQMIHKRGGCFVSDVVGLGKSYIGAAIVKHFEQQHRCRPLIICPASLLDMWVHYNEAYQLNAQVLSMGMLKEDDRYGPDWILRDERYAYRDFVLVDESHNFRHTDSQRYRVLETLLAAGNKRCVFLTATPRNQSVWDIYNQMKLFHPDDVTDLDVDPPNLREYFKRVENGERRLPPLLAQVLIRRTRNHILRWYGYDSETGERVDPDNFEPYREGQRRAYVLVGERKQFFPQRRLETIGYSIEDTYEGLYERLRSHMGRPRLGGEKPVPDELTYARYGLWNYVRPAWRAKRPYSELERAGANLRGLMRVMLFKRLESSVHAFRETVRRMLWTHQAFLAALDQGIVPAGQEAQRLLYESDREEERALMDALGAMEERYAAEAFDTAALRADIEQDVRVLSEMLKLVQPITPDQDDKLQALRGLLNREDIRAGKRLIFTQYADTAQYLYDNLNPHGARPDIEVIYSQQKSKAAVVGRFAPRANPEHAPAEGEPQIDTLIATDVLSEGLNLQDCDKVINYDLHWNPVRLIQRLGRIDRIGSEHDQVFAYNFLPETNLERNLGLHEKLAHRIQEIHDTIGEDDRILDPGERLNKEAMYCIYGEGNIAPYEDDDADELVDSNEALEMVRQLKETQPALYSRIAALRDGIRCGRRADQAGTFIYCRAGGYHQLFLLDDRGDIVSRDTPHILGRLKCEPDTPSEPLPPGYDEMIMRVKRLFEGEVRSRQAERAHTVILPRAQQYIGQELQVLYRETQDADLRRQIALLDAVFRHPLRKPAVRAELGRIHREKLTGMALLDELSRLYAFYALEPPTPEQEAAAVKNDDLPRVVCSAGLVRR